MKHSRPILLSVAGILLLVLGVLVYLAFSKRASAPATEAPSITASSTSGFARTEETPTVSIDVTYPMINETFAGAKEANDAIKQELDLRIAQFKKEASSSAEMEIDLPPSVKSSAVGGYSVEYENERFVSIFFSAEWYMRGAAHPYHTIHTYIFDKKLGKLVTLQDLFKPYSDYLKFLSTYAHDDLVQQEKEGDIGFAYDEQMLKSGTDATLENFRHVLPTKDGLMFYFDEYQVAPYAAGSQQVAVPYEKLGEYIEPTSVLGMFIK